MLQNVSCGNPYQTSCAAAATQTEHPLHNRAGQSASWQENTETEDCGHTEAAVFVEQTIVSSAQRSVGTTEIELNGEPLINCTETTV